jgi:hypothetical protein
MILDSGATQHIFKNNTYFNSYSPCVMHIIVANGVQVDGIGVGSNKIKITEGLSS